MICRHIKYKLIIISLIIFNQIQSQEFKSKLFDETNGLNRNYVNDIFRDKWGYYWLATEKGIVRFDGNNFTTFPNTEDKINNSTISKIHSYKNYLYLVYEKKGCIKFNTENHSAEIVTTENIDDIYQENDSTLFVLQNSTLEKRTRENINFKIRLAVKDNYEINKGTITSWNNDLIVTLPKQTITLVSKNNITIKRKWEIDTIDIKKCFGIELTHFFFSGNGKLYKVSKSGNITIAENLPANNTNNYTEWKSISNNTGFYIVNNSKLFSYTKNIYKPVPINDLRNIELKNIYIQDSSNILIGTNTGLLHLYKNNKGNYSFIELEDLLLDRIRIRRKIIPWEKNKYLLLGHPYNYLYERNGKSTLFSNKTASSYDGVLVSDELFIATEDEGILKFNSKTGKYKNFTNKFLPINRKHYCIIYNKRDSLLISAFNDTLLIFDFKIQQFKTIKSPLTGKNIKIIRRDDSTGDYWIGTESGIIKLDSKFQHNFTKPRTTGALHHHFINDIILDSSGNDLWIAHENGIVKMRKSDMQLTDSIPSDLFKNPKIVSLLQDKKGRIWMGTYSGIVAYDPVSKGLIKLNKQNGIINNEFNFTSASKTSDEEFIFGGLNGYDVINPTKFPINKPLQNGIITGYEIVSENRNEFHGINQNTSLKIKFNTEKESLRILLGSKETLTSFNYTYQYRFNNEAWSDLSNSPLIYISKLQPGIYNTQIKAYDNFGSPITYPPFAIEAFIPFYKSKIFLVLLSSISILLMAFVIYLIRRNHKRENHIKENISMDLHDEIGTLLARALLVSQTKSLPNKESHLNNYLGEALYGLRVYINTMNVVKLSALQLFTEIKEMMHVSFSPLNYSYKIEENNLSGINLSAPKFRCIKLCFYEILNNMIRHSNGNNMEVIISLEGSFLNLSVKDNGSINNLSQLFSTGNGIKNLKKRILSQKGQILNEIGLEGHGLITKIKIPI